MSNYPDKRVARSRAALSQSFLELLQQKTLHAITISEIVERADYNRGTFYAHFRTKQELMESIIDDTLQEMIRQIKIPYEQSAVVNLNDLPAENISLFTYFFRNAILYKTLLSPNAETDFRHRLANAIEGLFLAEYDYELPEGSTLDPRWLYTYRAHGLAGLIVRWIEEDFPDPPLHMAEQVVELMVVSTKVFRIKEDG